MFGHNFRKTYFKLLDADVIPVNHGSFGLTPDPVYKAFKDSMDFDFQYPERFLRFDMRKEYATTLEALGELLKVDYRSLALVENATNGINTVLRSFPLNKGDKIVYVNSTVYGACGNTIKFLLDYFGIIPIAIDLEYPLSDDDVVNKFASVFEAEKPKIAFFDTISSMPGVRVPFERLTALCKENHVISVIDGAHLVGAIPIDLGALDPDFFVSNLHKWLFVPRGCAVLYVNSKHHDIIQTMPISHSYKLPGATTNPTSLVKLMSPDSPNLLISKFEFYGTGNFSLRMSVIPAIEFRKNVCGGEQKIYDYCHGLAVEVGEKLLAKYKTSYLENDEKTLTTTMVNVELPDIGYTPEYYAANQGRIELETHVEMLYERKAFTPVIVHNGKIYARLSCQLYNEYEDYEKAMDILLEVLRESAAKDNKLKGGFFKRFLS